MGPQLLGKGDSERSCDNACQTEAQSVNSSQEDEAVAPPPRQLPLDPASSLTSLVLKSHALKEFPDVAAMDHLTELDLENNQLSSVPESLVKLTNLRVVKLSRNKLTFVPKCFAKGLFIIHHLDLSHNEICWFTEAPKCLPNLKALLLNNNNLQSIPSWLFFPVSFSFDLLDLSSNIKMFSSSVTSTDHGKHLFVRSVAHLKVASVRLTGLFGKMLSAFTSIEVLTLNSLSGSLETQTYIDIFTELIPFANSLKKVEAHALGINNLSHSLSDFKALESLDVSNNSVNWLPTTFSNMMSLSVLRMSSTSLFLLPDDFGKVRTLRELYLDGNMLSSLPASFRELSNLEVLDLYNNSFYSLPDLGTLRNLRGLDLCMNFFMPPETIKVKGREVSCAQLRDEILQGLPDPHERSSCEKESSIIEATPDIDSDAYSLQSFGDSCEDPDDVPMEAMTYRVENDEDWNDAVWNDDDEFDPNLHRTLTPQSDSSLIIPYHLRQRPGYFCPFTQSALMVPRVFTSSDIEEGQFSDN